MLEVGAKTAVHSDRGPLVTQHARFGLAEVDHGLDRQHHAFAQLGAASAIAEVRNLRFFVQPRPDAVSYKLAHHAESRGFHMLLYSRANIFYRVADPRLLN